MRFNKIKLGMLTGISFLALSASSAYAEHHEVKASTLLGSDVEVGTNTVAVVDNILLDEDSQEAQYLFFEASETFDQLDGRNGYVAWDDIELELSTELLELTVVVTDEANQLKPEDLTVTRSEGDHRLVGNILDEPIYFSRTQTARIDDLLIDSNSGEITSFVLEMDTESLFDEDVRVIPADEVSINEMGEVLTSAIFEDVQMGDKYKR